jgi:serine/threonine protein kinase
MIAVSTSRTHDPTTMLNRPTEIIHGDLKPHNILIDFVENKIVTAKICDYGCSRSWSSSAERITAARTTPWNAPEADDRLDGYSSHEARLTDVFSFGMLRFWTIFADKLPVSLGVNEDSTDISPEELESTYRLSEELEK